MKAKILFFASLKEALQKDSLVLDLSPPLRGKDLKAILGEKFPAIQHKLTYCRIACNYEFLEDQELLPEEDYLEIGLIPPVSGG